MLQLVNISKVYEVGDFKQEALADINLSFRQNEFVSILGPSGSGKTTMLNIIGGLDQYTDGDLKINGRSTKEFKDRDWDNYRNNSIGFVFQSYNLIGHQSVLSNVELALTLAGVSKKERRARAKEALEKVGLKDHINKKPNQLSGGQMQRVAIARALVNNPEILLADEPTGALDTETSVQIMDLLKEIAKDRLVIMVTHNPDLANEYSNRIIELLDGRVINDSNPYEGVSEDTAEENKKRHTSMSFFTALSLSFNNLATKLGRTLLTAFAGSIGIIGIALILSLSTGIQSYINQVQQDTLASYPIQITEEENPFMALLSSQQEEDVEHGNDKVYSNEIMQNFFNTAFVDTGRKNNIGAFREAMNEELATTRDEESEQESIDSAVATVQYGYEMPMSIYVQEDEDLENRNEDYRDTSFDAIFQQPRELEQQASQMQLPLFSEILPDKEGNGISPMIHDQYELVHGEWPENRDEIVLVLDKNNEVPDVGFYALGLITEGEIRDIMRSAETGNRVEVQRSEADYEELIGKEFKLLLNKDFYVKNPDQSYRDIRDEERSLQLAIENGYDLKIAGIIRPKEDATAEIIQGVFGYHTDLTTYLIEETNNTEIVQAQLDEDNENLDVITQLPFELTEEQELDTAEKATAFRDYIADLNETEKSRLYQEILATPNQEDLDELVNNVLAEYPDRQDKIQLTATAFDFDEEQAEEYMSDYTDEELEDFMRQMIEEQVKLTYEENAIGQVFQIKQGAQGEEIYGVQGDVLVAQALDQMLLALPDDESVAELYDKHMPNVTSPSTYQENLDKLAVVNEDSPTSMNIYANNYEDKEAIDAFISEYNEGVNEEDQIEYTDYVGLIMSGVTTMVNAVTYGLIAFVSISLIVSSIMIGIITYISVLERTKEIGILRSVGASKKDISRVFNAETLIIGLSAGILGILVTLLLNIPISNIIKNLTDIDNIAILPWQAAVALIVLSMLLTIIAGIIPSRMAAKKDPVEALRSE